MYKVLVLARQVYSSNPLRVVLWLGALVLLIVPMQAAHADIGPKPTMEFTFEFNIPKVDIVSGVQMQCQQPDCSDAHPLEELGPQHFACTSDACESMAYGFADYNKLVITFTDRERESNIFSTTDFNAKFKVVVDENSLTVTQTSSSGSGGGAGGGGDGDKPILPLCGSAGLLTLVIETLVISLLVGALNLPRVLVGWTPVASLLTLPAVWYLFPRLAMPAGWVTGGSEAFAVLVEAGFLHLVTGRRVPLHTALLISALMNAASFLAGWFFIR